MVHACDRTGEHCSCGGADPDSDITLAVNAFLALLAFVDPTGQAADNKWTSLSAGIACVTFLTLLYDTGAIAWNLEWTVDHVLRVLKENDGPDATPFQKAQSQRLCVLHAYVAQ